MLYVISFTRDGRYEEHTGSYAQCRAMADYIARTFKSITDVKVERVG